MWWVRPSTRSRRYIAFIEHRPQVTVMDISLPGASGIDALRRIRTRAPQARVLMFSMYEDSVFAARALQAGARGYVTKAAAPEALVEAVLTVARGEPYLVGRVAQELALRNVTEANDAAELLSPREFEVLWPDGHCPRSPETSALPPRP